MTSAARAFQVLRRGLVPGLGHTLALSLVARVAVAAVGLLITPIYLRLLGPQAYGLVAFWVVAQSWMIVFDLGISPAISRQLSRYRGGALGADEAASLLRLAERVFGAVAISAGVVFLAATPWIGARWLGASRLPATVIDSALALTGGLLVLRWMTGFYQSALVGLERQVACNVIALLGLILRGGGAIVALLLIGRAPVIFFAAQALGALAEAIASRVLLSRAAPRGAADARVGRRLLWGEARFAAGLAVSSIAATVINQTDKIVLSHALPLGEFGLFGLVVSICSGISMVGPPFIQAVQPRLTALLAQERMEAFADLYRLAFAGLIAALGALAGTIAALPRWVLLAWTGDDGLAAHLAPALSLYAAGTGISAFLFLPYLLQFAFGNVRLHVIGNLLFGLVWVPAAIFAALRYGAIGAGAVWLGGNVAYLCLWTPLVHRRFLTADARHGLAGRGVFSVAAMGLVLLLARFAEPLIRDRWMALVALCLVAPAVCAVGLVSSSPLREFARRSLSGALAPANAAASGP